MTDKTLFNDEDSNTSANPTFDSVPQARLQRRGLLRGSVGTMGSVMLGGLGVAAFGGGTDVVAATVPAATLLAFGAVPKSLADVVSVPTGYTASIIYALGDPLSANTPAYKNDGNDLDYENRAGDHHDGMEWYGLDTTGRYSTHIANGEVYFTLTNNSNRAVNSTTMPPDSANPRVYTDMKGAKGQTGNPNGHILRMKEGALGNAATGFTWDVCMFGAESTAAPGSVNLSSLTADQDFSSPDGLAFSPSTGIMWIQTDDGAYTDVTNCMMLAALPGSVGDGAKKTLSYTKTDGSTLSVDTFVGKAPTANTLKRFLVGARDSEITGLCETPDGKAMFINIQHPGENTLQANIADPSKYTSQWPSIARYGSGKHPRSATIVITKNDGGKIGT